MSEAVPVKCAHRQRGLDRQRVGTGAASRLQPTYIGKLEAEGVIQRHGDRFDLDAARVAYLRFLRRERQRSPRHEADADGNAAHPDGAHRSDRGHRAHASERHGGAVLVRSSSQGDRIDEVVHQVRTEIAIAFTSMADSDQVGERRWSSRADSVDADAP